MNPYFMKEMSWLDFDRKRKETDLCIIPSGACEVYGPHLPLGTDTIVAEELSLKLGPMVNAVITPCVQMGESFGLGEFPGTVVIGTESFKCYMDDVIKSMMGWGFKRFFFLTMHAGNVPIISRLAREYRKSHEIKAAQVDWWRFVQQHCGDILKNTGYTAHGHASECGTSVMMHLRPDLVDKTRISNNPPKDLKIYTAYPDIIKFNHTFKDYTDNGSVGDATEATAEKGQALVSRCLDRMAEYINNEL